MQENATIAGLDHEEVCTGDGTGRVGGVGDAAHKWLHLRQLKRLMQLLTMSAMLRSAVPFLHSLRLCTDA